MAPQVVKAPVTIGGELGTEEVFEIKKNTILEKFFDENKLIMNFVDNIFEVLDQKK